MANGGFLIKFNGKEVVRCFSCKFDYDEWQYEVNDTGAKAIPDNVKKIEIIVEPEG